MARRFFLPLFLFLLFLCSKSFAADTPPAPPTVNLTVELLPKDVANHRPAQVFITVETNQDLKDAVLTIGVPPGFSIDSPSINLPALTRSVVRSATIHTTGDALLAGSRAVTVELSVPEGSNTRRILASRKLTFDYSPEISLAWYFALSSAGVLLGYWLRLFVRILGTVPAPAPAPEEAAAASSPGRITAFVQAHYYFVDFLVTLGLSIVLMIGLIQGGRPPQTGASWYSALALGVGFGLFTNSELLTKLKR